jgi:hypothetical protein
MPDLQDTTWLLTVLTNHSGLKMSLVDGLNIHTHEPVKWKYVGTGMADTSRPIF